MSSPINRKLGGLTGELNRMGVSITPNTDPSQVGWNFDGAVTLGDKALSRVHQGAMAAVDTAGGVFAFQNPLDVAVLVTKIHLVWTTPSSGACTVSAGVAANGTTLNAGLVSGQSVASAAGSVSSTVPKVMDANGGSNDWVTVSVASGASAGLVGRVYIEYIPIG